MTNQTKSRSYNFGDTFGEPLELDPLPPHPVIEGPWRNQADGTLEQDDAVRQHGGTA